MPSKTTSAAPSSSSEPRVTTAEQWAAAVLEAELPSGARVRFRFPSLAEIVELGELPPDLLEIAVAEWKSPGSAAELAAEPFEQLPDEPSEEQLEQASAAAREVSEKIAGLNRELIARALVEPAMTAAQLQSVPYSDLEYLTRIINRAEPFDAAGRRIGPEPISTFRVFAEAHDCAADCPACETSRRNVSALQ
jgi:hypothetical protein